MRVHIEERTVWLEGANDLGSLSVLTDLAGELLDTAMRQHSLGEPDADGRHVWLEPSAITALAGSGDDWRVRFEAMLGFARDHGWIDDRDRIRSHIEPSSSVSGAGLD